MPLPEMPVIAEGEAPGGARWYLKAGGSAEDYYTMIETVHADGRRDEGGMGGPPLYPGSLLNLYTGRADDGPLRVIVRADPRVRRLRLESGNHQWCESLPVGDDPAVGVTFFASLLPWRTEVTSMQGMAADGEVLEETGVMRPGLPGPGRGGRPG
jgi:hypothetical protein